MQKRIPNSKLMVIKGAGHASMYEKPYEFISAALGFVENCNKKIKIIYARRMSSEHIHTNIAKQYGNRRYLCTSIIRHNTDIQNFKHN